MANNRYLEALSMFNNGIDGAVINTSNAVQAAANPLIEAINKIKSAPNKDKQENNLALPNYGETRRGMKGKSDAVNNASKKFRDYEQQSKDSLAQTLDKKANNIIDSSNQFWGQGKAASDSANRALDRINMSRNDKMQSIQNSIAQDEANYQNFLDMLNEQNVKERIARPLRQQAQYNAAMESSKNIHNQEQAAADSAGFAANNIAEQKKQQDLQNADELERMLLSNVDTSIKARPETPKEPEPSRDINAKNADLYEDVLLDGIQEPNRQPTKEELQNKFLNNYENQLLNINNSSQQDNRQTLAQMATATQDSKNTVDFDLAEAMQKGPEWVYEQLQKEKLKREQQNQASTPKEDLSFYERTLLGAIASQPHSPQFSMGRALNPELMLEPRETRNIQQAQSQPEPLSAEQQVENLLNSYEQPQAQQNQQMANSAPMIEQPRQLSLEEFERGDASLDDYTTGTVLVSDKNPIAAKSLLAGLNNKTNKMRNQFNTQLGSILDSTSMEEGDKTAAFLAQVENDKLRIGGDASKSRFMSQKAIELGLVPNANVDGSASQKKLLMKAIAEDYGIDQSDREDMNQINNAFKEIRDAGFEVTPETVYAVLAASNDKDSNLSFFGNMSIDNAVRSALYQIKKEGTQQNKLYNSVRKLGKIQQVMDNGMEAVQKFGQIFSPESSPEERSQYAQAYVFYDMYKSLPKAQQKTIEKLFKETNNINNLGDKEIEFLQNIGAAMYANHGGANPYFVNPQYIAYDYFDFREKFQEVIKMNEAIKKMRMLEAL